MWKFRFCFSFFPFLSIPSCITQKQYCVFGWSAHQMTALQSNIFLFWLELQASYDHWVMAPNNHCSQFLICEFVHTYMDDLKNKGHIKTFYLLNDYSSISDIFFLGYSRMWNSKLGLLTCVATSFQCDILCVLTHLTRKLQVVQYIDILHIEWLLYYRKCLFC